MSRIAEVKISLYKNMASSRSYASEMKEKTTERRLRPIYGRITYILQLSVQNM